MTNALANGVPQGQRNETAARLIDYFHGLLMPPDIIELVVSPFADRCDPPFDKTELREVIRSVTRYQNVAAKEQITDAPTHHEEGETHVFTWEGRQVQLRLDDVRHTGQGVAARLEVLTTLPGYRPHLHGPVDWKLASTSGRESLFRYLRKQVELDWASVLDQAARLTMRLYAEGEPSVLLRDYVDTDDQQYAIDPLVLEDGPTVVFGDRGTTKSYMALAVMISLTTGIEIIPRLRPAVRHRGLYLDWEASQRTHNRRMRMLVAGAGLTGELPDIVYRRCVGPLAEQVTQIRRVIAEHSIGFVVRDSIGLAAGGELEKPEVATRYFDAVRRLKIANLSISHVTKDGKDSKPFGSAYWHNSARSTFEVKKHQESGLPHVDVGVYNRKSNDDMLARPFGLRLNFEPEMVWYESINVHDVPDLARGSTVLDQMKELLKRGRLPVNVLAEEIGTTEGAIRTKLNANKDVFIDFTGEGSRKEWGLRA